MFEICFHCKKKGSQIRFSSPLPADETPKRWEFHNFVYVCVQNVPTVDSTQEMSQSDSPTRGPTLFHKNANPSPASTTVFAL